MSASLRLSVRRTHSCGILPVDVRDPLGANQSMCKSKLRTTATVSVGQDRPVVTHIQRCGQIDEASAFVGVVSPRRGIVAGSGHGVHVVRRNIHAEYLRRVGPDHPFRPQGIRFGRDHMPGRVPSDQPIADVVRARARREGIQLDSARSRQRSGTTDRSIRASSTTGLRSKIEIERRVGREWKQPTGLAAVHLDGRARIVDDVAHESQRRVIECNAPAREVVGQQAPSLSTRTPHTRPSESVVR